ncbi:universal stress protein [Curtobacterium sp. A7_M15]|uniref:universal stress protein n=1 Tax=Curtobacterium sp. A7_M15 TaxID=3065241 RepID=UPI002737A968|nr:universal stress protein [Curtobacterium sp. A7_M15]MDP4332413.1 universal stress protein [Curtobacterium sp. A7_M15]
MVESDTAGVVVVGVQPGQGPDVVGIAAAVAEQFSARLVCVVADPALLAAGVRADGSEIIEPIDPDTADSEPQQLPDEDMRVIRDLAAARSVDVDFVSRVGDPSHALAAVAEERDALMIVVGSQAGRRRMAELLTGSVAAHLTQQQHRPVLVVPHHPVGVPMFRPSDAP